MKYTVTWEEWVWDAVDVVDSINPQKPFQVEADTLKEAIVLAEKQASGIVSEERRGQWSTGTFVPELLSLTDELGNREIIQKPSICNGHGGTTFVT